MAEDVVGDESPEHGQFAGEGDFGDSADDVPLPYRGLDQGLDPIDEDDEDDDEDDDAEAEDVDAEDVGGGTAPKRSSNLTFEDIIVLVGDVDKNGSLTLDEAVAALTGWGKNTTRKEPCLRQQSSRTQRRGFWPILTRAAVVTWRTYAFAVYTVL